MNDEELNKKEDEFFITSVEGYWTICGLVISQDLVCSEYLFVQRGFGN